MKRVLIWTSLFLLIVGITNLNAKKFKVDKLKFPPLNEIKKANISKETLNNGIKLRLISDERFPIVTVRAYIKGGDIYDPVNKTGLSSITAELLRIGGAANYNSDEIDNMLDSKGTSISIYSNTDYFIVSLSTLKENLDESLRILSLMLRKPRFNKEKFDEIKTRLSSAISRRNDDPASVASREFENVIYGKDSPVSAQIEYEKLDNIKIGDVKALYNRFFKPSENFIVGITGPAKIDEFKKSFATYFESWKGKPDIPEYPEVKEVSNNFKIAFAQKDNLNQSYINIGHFGYKENIDKKAGILVFNSIFSQGFNSRLMQRLRVKMGLTYGVGGGIINSYLHPGKVYFSTFTKSESTITVLKAFYDEVNRIRKELVSGTELNDAKNYFLNSYVFKFSSPEKILYSYLEKEFYGLDIEKYDNLIEEIKKVTAEDVLKVAKEYLNPEKMVAMVVGNKKKIKGDLSELGKVKMVDITIKEPELKEKIPEATPVSLERGKKTVFEALLKNYRGYKNLKSLKVVSSVELNMMGRKFSVENESYSKFPDKSYTLTKVMGMRMERIINGNKGIMKQMGQVKPISEADILKGRFGSIYDIFHNTSKYNFQYLKTEKIGKGSYDVIYVNDSAGNWVKFFINRRTKLIGYKEKIDNVAGEKGVAKIVNTKFKKVNGTYFSFKTDIMMKGKKKVGIDITKIEVNPAIKNELFEIK